MAISGTGNRIKRLGFLTAGRGFSISCRAWVAEALKWQDTRPVLLPPRHGRAQSRPSALRRRGVDGRDKPGHDGGATDTARPSSCYGFFRHFLPSSWDDVRA